MSLAFVSDSSLLARLIRRIHREFDRLRPASRRWRRRAIEQGRAFDRRYGVETGGIVPLGGLGITSEHRRYGVDYVGVDPEELEAALALVPARPKDLTFVDLGSGKGRAVLLASAHPFQRVIGVEFAPELHAIAESNLDRAGALPRAARKVELHCMDAAAYELPKEPLLLFLYNPFGEAVMRVVAHRLRESLRRAPRPAYVLYVNPFQLAAWEAEGFEVLVRRETFVILVPEAPPGA
jgi:predicted RNA methylase